MPSNEIQNGSFVEDDQKNDLIDYNSEYSDHEISYQTLVLWAQQ